MFWTVFILLAVAALLIVATFAVRLLARLRELQTELTRTRAELEPRVAALRKATEQVQTTTRAETTRAGRTIGGAGGAAQRG